MGMDGGTRLAQRVMIADAIDEYAPGIIAVAQRIHAQPELGFAEHFACRLLTTELARLGYTIEQPLAGLPTAFRATKQGRGAGPTVAVLAEYDALPGIGHGCGHNLIAAAALAAATGLAPVLHQLPGRLVIIGTPAEEGGGGKIYLQRAGVFDEVDAALMVHHAGPYSYAPVEYPEDTCLALANLSFEFHGQSAHAAATPEQGRNALNGVLAFFEGMDALRQHAPSDLRVHGIITHGGAAANVVPDYARAHFFLRAPSGAAVEALVDRARSLALAAATMTATTVEIHEEAPIFYDQRPAYVLGRRYEANMYEAGLEVTHRDRGVGPFSTDFGNLSHQLPAVCGSFAIAREEIPGHSQQVVEAAGSEFAFERLLRVSTAMALTVHDILVEPALLQAATDEHTRWSALYQPGA